MSSQARNDAHEDRVQLLRGIGAAGLFGAGLFLAMLALWPALGSDLGVGSSYVSEYASGPRGDWFTAVLVVHGWETSR